MVEVDAEAGLEVPVQHGVLLAGQDGGTRQAAAEDLQGGGKVGTRLLQEDERLCQGLDVGRDDELVRGLDGLTRAVRAHVDDGRPEGAEERFGVGEVGGLTSDHDGQHGVDGACLATGHRGVQDTDALVASRLGDGDGRLRADAAHVDEEGAGAGVCQDAVRTEHDLGDLRIRGEHRDDHIRLGDRRRDAVRSWPPAWTRRSTAGRLRLYPMTVCPARTRLAAMGEPMMPRPTKAMVRDWTADVATWSALPSARGGAAGGEGVTTGCTAHPGERTGGTRDGKKMYPMTE